MPSAKDWVRSRGWEPFPFQEEVWDLIAKGCSGLIHSSTGSGKTWAAWLGILEAHGGESAQGLKALWITPLRALAADTLAALSEPIADLVPGWQVDARTGDTTSSDRARQRKSLPDALVTTPESLTLMLSQPGVRERFGTLRAVVVDEWHELMSTKRGVQTELALARLRTVCPCLSTWGLSATLGNLKEAMATLVPGGGHLVSGLFDKEIVIDSLLPESTVRFPWAGNFGTQMIPRVAEAISGAGLSLVFCNTRAMAEIWFQGLSEASSLRIGLHHGSLSREEREAAERGLKEGSLDAVVCTSSLDLGVDFGPVDRVIQIGSPKGVARLLQRAGRSGHRPGAVSRVTCVPTHAIEMVDLASVRRAAQQGRIESRSPLEKPLDVLAQHLLTVGCGDGFVPEELLAEVRSTRAYRRLEQDEWDWCLDYARRGGPALRAYPEFQRLAEVDGVWKVTHEDLAKRHRMQVGTIVSDASVMVQYVGGGKLGTVEEGFVARLKPGDRFLFAGKPLEFVRIKDMSVHVRRASSVQGVVPRWAGGRLPLSSELSQAIRETLGEAREGELNSPELRLLSGLLEIQARWSAIPGPDELLIEQVADRDGFHVFVYPFEGRLVHEGMAALLAYRIGRLHRATLSLACNDYGFELLAPRRFPVEESFEEGILGEENLLEDIVASLNSTEMAKRQFREIARIAGLVFTGYPGQAKRAKQVQATSGLFFDVFERYDPGNLLLRQAREEVLERQLEQSRMAQALSRLRSCERVFTRPPRPTPLSFPILVDRLRETMSSESMRERIEGMALRLERAADAEAGASGVAQ